MGVYGLEDVLVNHEALVFRRGWIYPESFVARLYAAPYRRIDRYGWFLAKNYWLRRGTVNIASGLWAIDNFSGGSYHHWLVDVLPRVLVAEELHPDEQVLLLPRYFSRQAFVHFTLPAFPRIDRVGWIGARAKVHVDRLAFVPRPPRYVGEQLAEVARRIGGLAGEPGSSRRVYFSRAGDTRRRAVNERDVIRVLRSHDFEIVQIDPDKPWQQVRAALGAELMVGVHGGALSNLMFMPPGGRLLELRHGHDDIFFDVFREMANVLGLGYEKQVCELAHGADGFEINNVDLIVDLDLLRENLARHGDRAGLA